MVGVVFLHWRRTWSSRSRTSRPPQHRPAARAANSGAKKSRKNPETHRVSVLSGDATWGTPSVAVDQVKNGVADIAWTAEVFRRTLPAIEAFELPFMVSDLDKQQQARCEILPTECPGRILAFKVLAFHTDGGRHPYRGQKPSPAWLLLLAGSCAPRPVSVPKHSPRSAAHRSPYPPRPQKPLRAGVTVPGCRNRFPDRVSSSKSPSFMRNPSPDSPIQRPPC